jgi:hypothetical protein
MSRLSGPGGPLDLHAALGQAPGVGGPANLAPPGVDHQLQPFQAGEELGDLPLVGDPRAFAIAVAGAGMLADEGQDTLRPVVRRMSRPSGSLLARRACRARRPEPLGACRSARCHPHRCQVGQDDHAISDPSSR